MRGLVATRRILFSLPFLLLAPPPLAAEQAVLRVGVDPDYPPHQFLDGEGRPTGFDVEIFRAAADAEDLAYELVVLDWPDIRERLEEGTLDASPGVFKTDARRAYLLFSGPIAWVNHTAFVREGTPIRSGADLRGRTVLVAEDSLYADLYQEKDWKFELEEWPSSEEALDALAEGRGDAVVTLETLGLYTIRHKKLAGLHSIGKPLGEKKLRIAFATGQRDAREAIDDGLARIRASGEYDRIWDAWFGVLKPKGVPLGRVLAVGAGLLGLLAWLGGWAFLLRREVASQTRSLREHDARSRELERRLHEGEKLEALGRMAGGTAHDFSNLLTAITGNLSLARAEPGLPTGARTALDEIASVAESAEGMVERLLRFRRGESEPRSATSWNEVVEGAGSAIASLVPTEVRITRTLEAEPSAFSGSAPELERLLLNLVLNARDAVGSGGSIALETLSERGPGGSRAVLVVRDDGPGMDAATQARIFDPYFTTKPGGRGFGLATVRAIADRHGGEVTVDSKTGHGTAFRVAIPLP
ncbi:MAG: transporter substrate-binding domain-containing protein [Myxococcota bacterium]|nr:transporter substrate-binding domain-containing protein [Myxococcota bacterium]